MKKLLAFIAMTVMSVALANVSQAAIIMDGLQEFTLGDVKHPTTSSYNFEHIVTTSLQTEDFAALPAPLNVQNTVSFTTAPSLTFGNSIFGFFTLTSGSVIAQAPSGFLYYVGNGIFTPGLYFTGLGFDSAAINNVEFSLTINPLGGKLGGNILINLPDQPDNIPVTTPEPATALIWGGISLIGLVAGYRRKQLLTA